MRGIVVMFDRANGVGTIQGEDGIFYRFVAAAHSTGPFLDQRDPVTGGRRPDGLTSAEGEHAIGFHSGVRVEFSVSGDKAIQVGMIPSEERRGAPLPAEHAVKTHPEWPKGASSAGDASMWGYFVRNLAWWKCGFRGRASRKIGRAHV